LFWMTGLPVGNTHDRKEIAPYQCQGTLRHPHENSGRGMVAVFSVEPCTALPQDEPVQWDDEQSRALKAALNEAYLLGFHLGPYLGGSWPSHAIGPAAPGDHISGFGTDE
jgi:hypothetical protein